MSPNEVPSVCGRLLTGYADVEALQIPSVESGRMPQYLLADRLAADMPVTTLAEEKRFNAFFRLQSPEIIAGLREKFPELPENPTPREVFVHLRLLRNKW